MYQVMGLTAIVSSATSTAVSMLSPVGMGVGGVFVAGALLFLLSYLDMLDASSVEDQQLRQTLVAIIVPLAVVFAGVVAFQSIQVL
jgi:amino acid transporter